MCTTRQFTDKQKRAQIRIVKNLIKKADLTNKSELQDFCYNLSYMNYMVRKGYAKTKFNADYDIYDLKAAAMQKLIDECKQNCSYWCGILYVYVNNRQYSYHDYHHQMQNTNDICRECKWDGIEAGFLLSNAEYKAQKHKQMSYIPQNWLSYYDNLRTIVQCFANSAGTKWRSYDIPESECLSVSDMKLRFANAIKYTEGKVYTGSYYDHNRQMYVENPRLVEVPTECTRLFNLVVSWVKQEYKKVSDADIMVNSFSWIKDYVEYLIRVEAEDILCKNLRPTIEAEFKVKRDAFVSEFFEKCNTLPKRSRESWDVVNKHFSTCWHKYREKLGYEELPDDVRTYFFSEYLFEDVIKKDYRYFIPSNYSRDYYWDEAHLQLMYSDYDKWLKNKADKVFASYVKKEGKKRVNALRHISTKAV